MLYVQTLELVAELVAVCSVLAPFVLGFVWAPKTWTPGELVTAASMNTNIRDHLNEGLRAQLTTSTGTQNDFALDGPFSYLKCNNATALTLTGALIDSGNIDGARVIVEAINAAVTLAHLDTGSASANRFTNDAGADLVLGLTERALLMYDTANTTWRVGKISTGAISNTLGAVNLFPDPYLIFWPGGDAVAPAGATLTKDGNSALARNTTTYLHSGMSAELKLGTTATVSTKLTWTLFSTLPVSWRGKTIGIGVWVRSATAALGFLEVADGGTGGTTASSYHDGGDAWTWITFLHTFTNDATKFDFSMVADIAAQDASEVTALFDGVTITLGPVPPADVKPPITTEGIVYFGKLAGNVATATDLNRFDARRPFLVTNVSLRAETVPTGAALIVDVNHWDGSVWQSMFSTEPEIGDAASPPAGGAEPDGTYRYRCFAGRKNDDANTDALMNYDVDQVGSTVTGADLRVSVAVLQVQDQLAAEKL